MAKPTITISLEKVINLREATLAYEAALEYDICPNTDNYNEDYWGCTPAEIVKDMIWFIKKL